VKKPGFWNAISLKHFFNSKVELLDIGPPSHGPLCFGKYTSHPFNPLLCFTHIGIRIITLSGDGEF